jgi:NAD(P)-dependent dehydrogenase (short-subunit alcohol dehydrogenase family)
MFFLSMKTPGVEVRPIKQMSGGANFNEVFFTDVRIPDSQRLGKVGEGWKAALTTLMNERLAVGLPSGGLDVDELMELARDTDLEDGPAIKNQQVRGKIADWYVQQQGLKLTRYRTLTALSKGQTPGPESSIIKIVAAPKMQDMGAFAMELMGPAGIMKEEVPHAAGFQAQWIGGAGFRIAGGTDEILRNIVAERVLGMPADIRVDKDIPFNKLGKSEGRAMNRLDGKVAFLSGAARGIGGETARLMASVGAKVAIGDVLDERGRQTAKEIEAAGGQAIYVPLDVTQEASWAAAMDATVKKFGKLDVLVNNAGIFVGKGVEEASLDEWNKLVAVNLTGVLLGTRAALPHLKASGATSEHGAAIVNLASIAGLVGSQLDPLYSMTKGGVTLFTKSTALEFGRKGYKIRVNSIHPGLIETDMGQQTFAMRARQQGTNDTEKARQATLALHPIGRLGVANDIAKGIVFLASDDAGFMTGAGLVVDGGWTAH